MKNLSHLWLGREVSGRDISGGPHDTSHSVPPAWSLVILRYLHLCINTILIKKTKYVVKKFIETLSPFPIFKKIKLIKTIKRKSYIYDVRHSVKVLLITEDHLSIM